MLQLPEKLKIGLISIFILLGVFAVSFILSPNYKHQAPQQQTSYNQPAPPTPKLEKPAGFQSSDLFRDDDGDGLTNYQESIYGTNPENKDTNQNGISDYEDITQGKDPAVKGGNISDNAKLITNLTVQFYDWKRQKSSLNNLTLTKTEVDDFLKEKGLDHVILQELSAEESAKVILQNTTPSDEELFQYLEKRYSSAPLPEELVNYIYEANTKLDEAGGDVNLFIISLEDLNKRYQLEQMITTAQATFNALQNTRGYARMTQERDLAYIKTVHDILSEINASQNDPVMLVKEAEWLKEFLEKYLNQ